MPPLTYSRLTPQLRGMSTDYILIRLGVSKMVSIRRPPPRGEKGGQQVDDPMGVATASTPLYPSTNGKTGQGSCRLCLIPLAPVGDSFSMLPSNQFGRTADALGMDVALERQEGGVDQVGLETLSGKIPREDGRGFHDAICR